MELLERYLAAVADKLPEGLQDEVSRELRANILDQLDVERERSPEVPEQYVLRAVLAELGPPRTIAHRFHQPPPLILPEHLPIYRYTLFMVFGVLFLIQIVHSSMIWLSSEQMGLLLLMKSIAGGFIRDASFAFTVISLAFWLMGRQGTPEEPKSKPRWNPDKLPPLTRTWQRIGFSDTYHALGTYLFLLMLIWYPVWAGLPARLELTDSSRLLLQVFSPLLVLGVLLAVWQLLSRVWTPALLKLNLAFNTLLALAILVLVVSGPLLLAVPEPLQWTSLERWNLSVTITLLIIALFPAWEAVRDLRRLRSLANR